MHLLYHFHCYIFKNYFADDRMNYYSLFIIHKHIVNLLWTLRIINIRMLIIHMRKIYDVENHQVGGFQMVIFYFYAFKSFGIRLC